MARWDLAQATSRVKSVAPSFFLAKISFLVFSHYHGNHSLDFLAHDLHGIKTYHHAKLQTNPPTGLARIMAQTYKQIPSLYICIYVRLKPPHQMQ